MELVVDTNVLISAIIKSSKSRELLCSQKLVLFAPEHIISESLSNKEEIIGKAGISESEFNELLAILLSKINLALSIAKNIPLWSNDKELKEQSLVKVLSTEEIVAYFLF